MAHKAYVLLLVCLQLLLLAAQLTGASLRVSPARFMLHHIAPGRLYDIQKETGLKLTVYNDSSLTRSFVLSTRQPETGHFEAGYLAIPDASWCWFEKQELTVSPNSQASVGVILQVPDKPEFYNQKWIVVFGIKGKPGPGGISLAIDVRGQIETRSRADLAEIPQGVLATKPSIASFDGLRRGETSTSEVLLHNGDSCEHTYRFAPYFSTQEARPDVYLTGGYEPITDAGWVRASGGEIKLKPGESAKVPVEVRLPESADKTKGKWEQILLVLPDKGPQGFVRVHLQCAR